MVLPQFVVHKYQYNGTVLGYYLLNGRELNHKMATPNTAIVDGPLGWTQPNPTCMSATNVLIAIGS